MDSVPKKSGNVVFRKIEDEYVLVPMAASSDEVESIFNLNETGALIWEKIDGTRRLREIVDELADEFEEGERDLGEDVLSFVSDLLEAGLLEVS